MYIYVLAKADYQNYGRGTKAVEVFLDKESAVEEMRKEYLKEWAALDLNFLSHKSFECTEDYAYIEQCYYWDIFKKII